MLPLPLDVHLIEEPKVKRFKLLLWIAVLAGFPAIAYAGWDEGKAAYDRCDYATAYEEFKGAAEQGDAKAQYSSGIYVR